MRDILFKHRINYKLIFNHLQYLLQPLTYFPLKTAQTLCDKGIGYQRKCEEKLPMIKIRWSQKETIFIM